jgi:lysozyme
MSYSKLVLTDMLKLDEGLKLKPYRDSMGFMTIGYGRCLDTTGISKQEACVLLSNDIARTEKALDANIPWWTTLSDNRQLVLMDMAYNLGIEGLLEFKRMLADLQSGDFVSAANEMQTSRWYTQVGDRAVRLRSLLLQW